MPIVVNKTFDEIAVGDTASAARTLRAGDLRAWGAAFGESGRALPARARARMRQASSRHSDLRWSDRRSPVPAVRSAPPSVRIKGPLPIGAVMTARLVVQEKRRGPGDRRARRPLHRTRQAIVFATAILEVAGPHGATGPSTSPSTGWKGFSSVQEPRADADRCRLPVQRRRARLARSRPPRPD